MSCEVVLMLRPDTFALTAVLGLLTAFGPISTDMYVLSMPDIGRGFAADVSDVQLTLSAYLVGFALGQVIYGPMADRIGRRSALLQALALFGGASAMCAAAPNIETLIAARGLQALGVAGVVILPRAIVRDLYSGTDAGRELSRIGAIMSLAPVIAPLLGGLVQAAFGWRTNFIVVVSITILSAATVWLWLPETLHRTSTDVSSIRRLIHDYRLLLSDRLFRIHLGIAASSFAGLFAWISGSPFIMQEIYGLSALDFSILYAAVCVGSLVGGTVAAVIVSRIGLTKTIGAGAAIMAFAGVAMTVGVGFGVAPIAPLVVMMFVYQVGLMLGMPSAIAGAMTPFPDCAGTASSLVGFVQQVSAAIVGILVGHASGGSAWPMAIGIASMGILSLLLWIPLKAVRHKAA
jgi:DHA1 family bicyclomycin/chloramphenicol resistance-like MFS transporter